MATGVTVEAAQPSVSSWSTPSFRDSRLILYTYFRSSCSARVRTAAHLKGLKLSFEFVNLLNGEQNSAEYSKDINPSATVPTLIVQDAKGETQAVIRQSTAIIEFLEEAFPGTPPLLPPLTDPVRRATVRDLVNIIACDVQPPSNLRLLGKAETLGVTKADWAQFAMGKGLGAYEEVLKSTAGLYSVGDHVTMADVYLAPAVEAAQRWKVKLDEFPTLMRVFNTLNSHPAFVDGHWTNQDDTPAEFKRA